MLEVCRAYTDTSALTTTPLTDSSINDRQIKTHPLNFDENADENLSAVVYTTLCSEKNTRAHFLLYLHE